MRQLLAAISLALALSSGALAQDTVSTSAPIVPTATPVGNSASDPTQLTREAVDRAITQQKELFKVQLDAIIARMDRLQHALDLRPEEVAEAIAMAITNLDNLTKEKFDGRDRAIAAALDAAQKSVEDKNESNSQAISKSESNTKERIDGIILNVDTKTGAIDEKVNSLTDRLTTIESRAIGVSDNKTDNASIWGWVFGAVGAIAALLGIFGGIIIAVNNRREPVVVNGYGNGNGKPA